MLRWEWRARFYYGPNVKPPKKPGELVIETVHIGEQSLRTEVEVGRQREDIGRIKVWWIGPPPVTMEETSKILTTIIELERRNSS